MMTALSTSPLRHARHGRRLVGLLAGCALGAGALVAAPSSAHLVPLSSLYKPGMPGATAARGGPAGNAQEGQQWTGTAAIPDPAGLQLAPDVYEFDVLEGYDNDHMSVAIAWDGGLELAYDLDLYVDRLDGAQWVPSAARPTARRWATAPPSRSRRSMRRCSCPAATAPWSSTGRA